MKVVVKKLEKNLKKQGMKLRARATTPMSSNYRPDIDATAELDANNITMLQDLIGKLRWATYIGRVDILHEVLVLSAFKAAPREGIFSSDIPHICFYEKESESNNIF